jgi:Tol biopolymer transport system component
MRDRRGLARLVLGVVALTSSANAQGITERVSADSGGIQRFTWNGTAAVSTDGQVVTWVSNNGIGGINVLVHDRTTGITEIADRNAWSTNWSDGASISADGRFVVFWSDAPLVSGDTNLCADVFVFDRTTGVNERVSVGSSGEEGNGESGGVYVGNPSISADGRFVAFTSLATNLVFGDLNGSFDVFVHDRATGTTELVSADPHGVAGDGESGRNVAGSISADGRFVAFESAATNLVGGDSNGRDDVFVRDRVAGFTQRVSVGPFGAQARWGAICPSISADGRCVAFTSWSDDLVPGDTNDGEDVFVHDRSTGVTERVSVDSNGRQQHGTRYYYSEPGPRTISGDGRFVVFTSDAADLVPHDDNFAPDAFIHDRSTGATRRVSVDSSGRPVGRSGVRNAAISDHGGFVVFDSNSPNLVPGDTNNQTDVFVHECCLTHATWSNYGAGFPGTSGVPSLTASANPVLGRDLALDLGNSAGRYTVAALFIGRQRAAIPSSWGGLLLVDPVTTKIVGVGPGGTTLLGAIPEDHGSCGVTVDLQAIEIDPGAAQGVSFTAGLELVLGS